ncbi:hypothetical protein O983_28155 [Mycobacterium avium 09-5983]|nr:hypothetical protein O983_28155 [Mycobacterium avium 09-5983]
MSKISKPRDRWAQVFAAATDRAGMCCGCGYYFAVHARTAPTAQPSWPP